MEFALTAEQEQIREEILRLCARFGDDYWLRKEREATFPDEFYAAVAETGWLGISMPEEYGGAGLGIAEAAVMMQAVAGTETFVMAPDGVRLSVREWGNPLGPEILFIHGVAQCHLSFIRQTASTLADRYLRDVY